MIQRRITGRLIPYPQLYGHRILSQKLGNQQKEHGMSLQVGLM